MKVLYITNGVTGSGGLERVLSVKTSYLAEYYDYDVKIITLNEDVGTPFYQFSEKISFYDIKAKGNIFKYLFSYAKGILEVIDAFSPDIVCVCDDGLKGLFVPLYIRKRVKFIYERHTVKTAFVKSYGWFSRIKYILQSKIADFGSVMYDKFVVLTSQNKKEWPWADVEVIPNPNSFTISTPSTLANKKVISVGTMSHVKGFDLLLKAWQIVVCSHPEWHLVIYGKPVLKEELLSVARSLNIEEHVDLLEPVASIEYKYLDASMYVLSSRYEGFGMVLIEAMECGLPCVSFNCPLGPADIIDNNVNGLLVDLYDIHSLARNILVLIDSEDKRKSMGEQARKTAKKYRPDIIVKKWDQLFNRLVAT